MISGLMPPRRAVACTFMALPMGAAAALAQPVATSGMSAEITTDLRERGLGWSGGKPALVVDGTLALSPELSLDARAMTLRGSARHGGSDAGFDIGPRASIAVEDWDLSARVRGRFFTGQGTLDYVEAGLSAARTVGPAWVAVGVDFAPSQAAIGGDNLYLWSNASLGLPGTPVTLEAGGGYTMGENSSTAAARLRPRGNHANYHVGLEANRRNLSLGVRFSGTFGGKEAALPALPDQPGPEHSGERIAAYARVSL